MADTGRETVEDNRADRGTGLERVNVLSDGVFAIAFTLLTTGIRVPQIACPHPGLTAILYPCRACGCTCSRAC